MATGVITGTFLIRNKQAIAYGICMALLLFIIKWLEFRLVVVNHTFELYVGAIAMIFTALGVWLALKLAKPKIETVIIEKEVLVTAGPVLSTQGNEAASLNISRRELEVLQLMATGLSNQEVSERLFVSLNTVKTHASKLFEKLDVKRRTQAVEKARCLKIIS